ncbi:acyl-CoA dehydrogenase family protein [Saccharicrinis fermentans]|uniref:Acyl-CoA dehydrogenase n=1 Tax=Saccharicrinis fermentans DSM 9555 = JCM 21142 TaxID=869213 RepID=W7Y1Q4_9BACT|nr:acyl-CoA dehydrogenase family protein [Saccharicrinis fermentans]GAF04815.1 acyl-CoA dehydrogenase [Saccharicrinis fermentans DSM 9555 = JCM 21142]
MDTELLPFSQYLESFKETLKSVFYQRDNIEQFIQKRGFPALVLRDIMAKNPLSVGIPKEYGGRGVIMRECLAMLDAASYESLPLSLTFGINIALFLEPVGKYGSEEARKSIFNRFMTQQNMGGLMITEPDFGSDALSMQTYCEQDGTNYHVKGTKHWQGLTGMADYWLITSRKKLDNGDLARDIDFFVCDVQQSQQRIIVEEYYNNLGLFPIPYGKNKIDVIIPQSYKLIPESSGLNLMMDLLHRSRYQFPGMGMGFIRRMLDEAIAHCKSRMVSGKPLIQLDQVQHQINKIQSAFTVCSAMCARSAAYAGVEKNLSPDAIEANSMKAYVTDLMQMAAQVLTQLKGANGYKAESVSARGIIDSRPFRIFEGSNDMLYTQIFEMVSKLMVRQKNMNLLSFLKGFKLTQQVAERFDSLVDFVITPKMPQRKSVDMGKILSRIVSANHVFMMETKGFRQDLVANCIENLKHEVAMLVSSYQFTSAIQPVEDYKESSSWFHC